MDSLTRGPKEGSSGVAPKGRRVNKLPGTGKPGTWQASLSSAHALRRDNAAEGSGNRNGQS
jgi:hypothetical protein